MIWVDVGIPSDSPFSGLTLFNHKVSPCYDRRFSYDPRFWLASPQPVWCVSQALSSKPIRPKDATVTAVGPNVEREKGVVLSFAVAKVVAPKAVAPKVIAQIDVAQAARLLADPADLVPAVDPVDPVVWTQAG